jgi:hypothetical protein
METAKNEYPDGEIKSTKMVVYDYPCVGAMTVVKDKTTGDEHRIFIDVYTLDVVPDEPATETKRRIWSIYERRLKNGIDNNLKQWQKSDELTKSIEQAANDKGININLPVTEVNIKKLSGNTTITATTVQKTLVAPAYFAEKILNVPLYAQATYYYCQTASAQMIAKYYGVSHTQNYIYGKMNGVAPNGVDNDHALLYYRSSSGLNKPNSEKTTTVAYFGTVRSEIDASRPFIAEFLLILSKMLPITVLILPMPDLS